MKKPVKVVVNGEEKKYFVSKPTAKQDALAKLEANKKFREALDGGSYLREELNKKLMERGIWSDKEDKELKDRQTKLIECLNKLEEGGIELTEARELAIEAKRSRIAIVLLSHKLREHDGQTVEGQSDNAYFDTLVSLCSLDEEGNRLFKSYEDYLEKSSEDYAVACATELSSLVFGLNDDWEKELPENKFLLEYKFIDEEMNYIDSEGRKVDSEGNLVKEKEGPTVKEKKPFLVNGNPV